MISKFVSKQMGVLIKLVAENPEKSVLWIWTFGDWTE